MRGLSDRPWIVIVVVDDARAMTFGTGDDVAVLILNPAPAMALRTDFHAACPFRVDNIGSLRPQCTSSVAATSAPPPAKAIKFFRIPPERQNSQ